MSIKKICKNCLFSFGHYPPFKMVCRDCHYAQNDKDDPDTCFQAKEHLIREDERHKIITLLKSDLETLFTYNQDNYVQLKDVKEYIESIIKVLEKN